MAALVAQQVDADGLKPVFAAATALGDTMPCDGHTALFVVNGSGAGRTITIASQAVARPGLVVDDLEVVIPAGESWLILPDPVGFANENGQAEITYSAVATTTVAAVRI